jgi:hypothetical protein
VYGRSLTEITDTRGILRLVLFPFPFLSLDCCKQHKVKFECNGKRARSQFAASVREMNDASLLGDYYLMEDASRLVGGSNRGRPEKRQRNTKAKQLPFKLKKLVQAVEKQQGTLLIMPEEFERRKVNKSYFDDKRECVLWTIRWTFPEAQAQCAHSVPPSTVSHSYAVLPSLTSGLWGLMESEGRKKRDRAWEYVRARHNATAIHPCRASGTSYTKCRTINQ